MKPRGRPVHRAISSLGHDSRFQLALLLLECPACVSDLAKRVGLSQSCTTRHLQTLQRAGVVRGTRDGKRVVFRTVTDRDEVAALLALLTPEGAAMPESPPGAARPRARPTGRRTARNGRSAASAASPAADSVAAAARIAASESVPSPEPGETTELQFQPLRPEEPPEAQEDDPGPTTYRRRPDMEDYLL